MPAVAMKPEALFSALLASSPALPAGVHQAAWELAQRQGNLDLMAALVARVDAPADLVALYAKVSLPRVRAAYLARPGVSDSATDLVAGETRASVLASALHRTGNDPRVLDQAVRAFLARPTKALAEVLVALPSSRMTPELADVLLRTCDKSGRAPGTLYSYRRVAAQLGPVRLGALLAEVRTAPVAALLLGYTAPAEDVVAVLARVMPGVLKDLADASAVSDAVATAKAVIEAALRGTDDSGLVLAELRSLLRGWRGRTIDDLHAHANACRNLPPWPWPAGAGDESRQVVTARELAVLDQADGPGSTTAPSGTDGEVLDRRAVGAGVVSSDRAALAASVRWLRANWSELDYASAGSLAADVLQNRLLTVPERHAVLALVSREHVCRWHVLSEVDVLGLFGGDEVARSAWLRLSPAAVLSRYGWEPFGGQQRAAHWVRLWLSQGDRAAHLACAEAVSVGLSSAALLPMPASFVTSLVRPAGKPSGRERSLAALAGLLDERLGARQERWLTFYRLIDGFAGTLKQLLDVCVTVSPDAGTPGE